MVLAPFRFTAALTVCGACGTADVPSLSARDASLIDRDASEPRVEPDADANISSAGDAATGIHDAETVVLPAWPQLDVGEGCNCATDEVCGPDRACAPACTSQGDCALWVAEDTILSMHAAGNHVYWTIAPSRNDLGQRVGEGSLWKATYPDGAPRRLAVGRVDEILGVHGDYVLLRSDAGLFRALSEDVGNVLPLWPEFSPASDPRGGWLVPTFVGVPVYGRAQPALMGDFVYAAGTRGGQTGVWKLPASGEGTPLLLGPEHDDYTQLAVGGGHLMVVRGSMLYEVDIETGERVGQTWTTTRELTLFGVDEERWHADERGALSADLAAAGEWLSVLHFADEEAFALYRGWVYGFGQDVRDKSFGIARATTRGGREPQFVLPVTPVQEFENPVFSVSDAGIFWSLNRWGGQQRILFSPMTPPPCTEQIDCAGTAATCTDGGICE